MKYNRNCQCSPVKNAKRHDIIYRQVIWAGWAHYWLLLGAHSLARPPVRSEYWVNCEEIYL